MNLPGMAQTEHLGVIFTFDFLEFIEFKCLGNAFRCKMGFAFLNRWILAFIFGRLAGQMAVIQFVL